MSEQEDRPHWLAGAVSWGHLLVAMFSILMAIVGVIMTWQTRLVIVEERQQMVLRTVDDLHKTDSNLRQEVRVKLDLMNSKLEALTLLMATNNAENDARNRK